MYIFEINILKSVKKLLFRIRDPCLNITFLTQGYFKNQISRLHL